MSQWSWVAFRRPSRWRSCRDDRPRSPRRLRNEQDYIFKVLSIRRIEKYGVTYASINPDGPAPTTTTVVEASTWPILYPSWSALGDIMKFNVLIDISRKLHFYNYLFNSVRGNPHSSLKVIITIVLPHRPQQYPTRSCTNSRRLLGIHTPP